MGADGVTPAGVAGEQLTVSMIETDPVQVLRRGGVAVATKGLLQSSGANPGGLGDLGASDAPACMGVDERNGAAQCGRLNFANWGICEGVESGVEKCAKQRCRQQPLGLAAN